MTSLLEDFTVRENVGLAVQARVGGNLRVFDTVAGRKAVWEETAHLLSGSLLDDRRDARVADLSHGEKKQLELIVALATQPRLLLLDEPMAGLGHVETGQMIETLRGLHGEVSMLLVEHDMEAVFALADRISVLVYGQVIMTGTADEVRADPRVREAYLGTEDA